MRIRVLTLQERQAFIREVEAELGATHVEPPLWIAEHKGLKGYGIYREEAIADLDLALRGG